MKTKSFVLIDKRKEKCQCKKCLGSAWYDPFDVEGMLREKCISECKKELAKYLPLGLLLLGSAILIFKK